MPKTSEHQDHITSIKSALGRLAVMIVRTLATFLCGMVSLFLLVQLDSWVDKPYANLALPLLISFGPFILAGVVGCAITPRHPYRAASTVVIGVFVGIIIHIILYPTINGFERNLFPLEIVGDTLLAAFCCFFTAALWRECSHFFMSEKNSA